MRRGVARRIPTRTLALIAATLALAMLLTLIVGRIGGPGEGMSPEALRHIEAQNRKAAISAAATQRAESQASAEAADREATRRDIGNEAATGLTRFETVNEGAAAR